MDANEKQAHERARRLALARAAGHDPSEEELAKPEAAGPEPSINVLISRLTSERREWRDECAALLVARGALAVPALLGALGHASPRVRYHAAWALGILQDDRALGPLIERLGDIEESHGGVAAGAEAALRRFGARALPALLVAAASGPERIQTRAIRLLGNLGAAAEVARGPLRALLAAGSANVRVQAATALGRLAASDAHGQATGEIVGDLVAALEDASRFVRCAAAEALAHLGRPEARAVLEAVKGDPEDLYEARWADELLELLA